MMSTSYEVPYEPLVSDGSNYASWSIHVLNHLHTLGSLAERVLVASILPPNFSWDKIDWKNQSVMDCMQLNALVTDYLLSIVCTEVNETILEDEIVRENAYLIWNFLKDLYDKDCSVSSVAGIAPQETFFKSQEIKTSEISNLIVDVTTNVEVLDLTEIMKYASQMMNQPLPVLISYIMVIISVLWPQRKIHQTQIMIVIVIVIMMIMRS